MVFALYFIGVIFMAMVLFARYGKEGFWFSVLASILWPVQVIAVLVFVVVDSIKGE
jgi:tellurite resistance protein TehA-like permease